MCQIIKHVCLKGSTGGHKVSKCNLGNLQRNMPMFYKNAKKAWYKSISWLNCFQFI